MNEFIKNINIPIIKLISEEAAIRGIKTYLVGGFVRDIILKRKSKDIDIMVVGNGIDFAQGI